MKFTQQEIKEIERHGLSTKQVKDQVAIFKNGVPKVVLSQAATVGNGILKLDKDAQLAYIDTYEHHKKNLDILKFTPASGAASRMFKKVYQFLAEYDNKKESIEDYIHRKDDSFIERFFNNLKKFPFYEEVVDTLDKEYTQEQLKDEDFKKYAFVKTMMSEDQHNYGDYPKGLLPFHNYESYMATAFEEHLHEAAAYASKNEQAKLHFTISPEHESRFKEHYDEIHASVSNTTGVDYNVSYSFQKPETDTVAVREDNTLYRKADGAILFRPGGHGALIANLNEVDADLIFIKNIDNVLVQDKIPTLSHYKSMLAGLLLELQQKAFKYREELEEDTLSEDGLNALEAFLTNEYSTKLGKDYEGFSLDEKKKYLKDILDRPLRVCGMVKNEGEPGGGPFWVTNQDGKTTLQIIESAQVDKDDSGQLKIFNNSTHFNPVDIVCGVRNYKGEKYNLQNFVDPDLAFIASKTDNGTPIKALELPGLWNGAMAHWNTLFVEVPVETFNPVKTVNDLLKPSHQVAE